MAQPRCKSWGGQVGPLMLQIHRPTVLTAQTLTALACVFVQF